MQLNAADPPCIGHSLSLVSRCRAREMGALASCDTLPPLREQPIRAEVRLNSSTKAALQQISQQ